MTIEHALWTMTGDGYRVECYPGYRLYVHMGSTIIARTKAKDDASARKIAKQWTEGRQIELGLEDDDERD